MQKRILFVDDDPNFLAAMKRMLRHQRELWDLVFVDSAAHAIEAVSATPFDIIVSDVTMPGKSGLDLLVELRDLGVAEVTPVIMLTGNAEADLKRQALELGATDLLNKPVTTEDLLARLNSVLRLKEYQDALRNQNVILEQRVRERTAALEHSRRDILWRLAKAGEFRDVETGEHVIRVACCSRILATAAGLEERDVERIFLTAPLHDIGKIGVPDSVLLKKGKLTAEERLIMERHCEIGAAILREEPHGIEEFTGATPPPPETGSESGDPLRDMAVQIALNHHERWDGSGYPRGLSGEAIPVAGRIVAIADMYDALRTERPYKRAFTLDETRDLMEKVTGNHLDPDLFGLYLRVEPEFEDVMARLSTFSAVE